LDVFVVTGSSQLAAIANIEKVNTAKSNNMGWIFISSYPVL